MNNENTRFALSRIMIVAYMSLFMGLAFVGIGHAATESSPAVIEALQGAAYVPGPEGGEDRKLSKGDSIAPWQTLMTETESKTLIGWSDRVMASLGGQSMLFLSVGEEGGKPIREAQLVEGVLRLVSPPNGSVSGPYSLVTPLVSVEPASPGEPLDVVAEAYEPGVSSITVLRGSAIIRKLAEGSTEENLAGPCQTVNVKEGKSGFDVAPIDPEGVARLVDATTIPGSTMAQIDPVCEAKYAAAPVPGPAPEPDYYYIEEEPITYLYPYEDIEVLPPRRAGGFLVVLLPGIGRWEIPYALYSSWGLAPDEVVWYVRRCLLDRALYNSSYYWNRSLVRTHEYRDLIYLSQMARNRRLLGQSLNRLGNERIRRDWMIRHWDKLRQRLAKVEDRQRRFGGDQARRARILSAVNQSFNSPANIQIANAFRQRIGQNAQAQARLADASAETIQGLRARMAHVRTPSERQRLRRQLTVAQSAVQNGRVPLASDNKAIEPLVRKFQHAEKYSQRVELQSQITRRLEREVRGKDPDPVSPQNLKALERQLGNRVGPQNRGQMETRLKDLNQLVAHRQEIDSERARVEQVMDQASERKDPNKRMQLLKQLGTAAAVAAPAAAALRGPLRQMSDQQRIHTKMLLEQDRDKQTQLKNRLEDITKHNLPSAQPKLGHPGKAPTQGLVGRERDRSKTDTSAQPPAILKQRDRELGRGQKDAAQKARSQQIQENQRRQSQEQLNRRQKEQAEQKLQRRRKQQEDAAQKARSQQIQENQRRKSQEQLEQRQKEQAEQKLQRRRKQQEDAAQKARSQQIQENQRRQSQEQLKQRQKEQAEQKLQLRRRQQEEAAQKARSQQNQENQRRQRQEQMKQRQENEARMRRESQRQRQEEMKRRAAESRRSQELATQKARQQQIRENQRRQLQDQMKRRQESEARKRIESQRRHQEQMRAQQARQRVEQQRRSQEQARRRAMDAQRKKMEEEAKRGRR